MLATKSCAEIELRMGPGVVCLGSSVMAFERLWQKWWQKGFWPDRRIFRPANSVRYSETIFAGALDCGGATLVTSRQTAPPPCTRRTSRASFRRVAAGALFVLAVSGRCAAHRVGQIAGRRESRCRGIDATGQPRRELLEQPAVAIRIFERGERAVAAVLGIRAADSDPAKQVGVVVPAYTPSLWNTSLTSTPRRSSSARVASRSETIRYRPCEEPGAAAVTFLPKMTEQPEPGGVNWSTRKSSS